MIRLLQKCLVVLFLGCVASLSALAQSYVLLQSSSAFETQVAGKKNTTFEVRSEIDLKGKTVVLPENAVLSFTGGSFKNGTLDLNGGFVTGPAKFDCTIRGKMKNELVDLGWFGLKSEDRSFDNGPIINRVAKEYGRLKLPAGTYYFSTPVQIGAASRLEFYGQLVYRGKVNTSALTITGTTAVINLYGAVSNYQNPAVRYEKGGATTNMVGITFKNLNNSRVFIAEVSYFNENIRIAGIGDGCCYNQFSFGLVRNANVGLRLYQENAGSKRGWANENYFTGGRFANFSDWDGNKYESYAVRIEGAGAKDSYNTCNSLHFTKQSFEGFKTIVYAKNVTASDFQYARVEGSKLFVKFVGNCKDNRVSADYNDGCRLSDDSESNLVPLALTDLPQFAVATFQNSSQSLIIDSSMTRLFRVRMTGKGRVIVRYLKDSNGKDIPASGLKSHGAPLNNISPGNITLYSNRSAYLNGSDLSDIAFRIPDTVSSFQLEISGSAQKAVVYSYNEAAIVSTK